MPQPPKGFDSTRFHFDVFVADRSAPMEEIVTAVDAQVAELVDLGATVDRDRHRCPATYSVVMRDPDGNEFCVA